MAAIPGCALCSCSIRATFRGRETDARPAERRRLDLEKGHHMAFTTFSGGKTDSALARLYNSVTENLRERRAYNAVFWQTWRELSALSDRELADLGFARSDIGYLSREAAERALLRR